MLVLQLMHEEHICEFLNYIGQHFSHCLKNILDKIVEHSDFLAFYHLQDIMNIPAPGTRVSGRLVPTNPDNGSISPG